MKKSVSLSEFQQRADVRLLNNERNGIVSELSHVYPLSKRQEIIAAGSAKDENRIGVIVPGPRGDTRMLVHTHVFDDKGVVDSGKVVVWNLCDNAIGKEPSKRGKDGKLVSGDKGVDPTDAVPSDQKARLRFRQEWLDDRHGLIVPVDKFYPPEFLVAKDAVLYDRDATTEELCLQLQEGFVSPLYPEVEREGEVTSIGTAEDGSINVEACGDVYQFPAHSFVMCQVGDKMNPEDLLVQPVMGVFSRSRVTYDMVRTNLRAQVEDSFEGDELTSFVDRRFSELRAEAFEAASIPVTGSTMSLVPVRLVSALAGDIWMFTRGLSTWQRVLKPDLVVNDRLIHLNYTRSRFWKGDKPYRSGRV